MKIIDLLNKIANGEEVPKKIKINNVIYEYQSYMYCTENANYQDIEDYLFGKWNFNILNYEVEILEEEKKIPEKLGYFDLTKDKNEKDENGDDLELHYTGVADTFDDVYEKINEIIDYLDYLKSKGE